MTTVRRLKPGDLVEVSYPVSDKFNNPARKLEGQQFLVKSVKYNSRLAGPYRTQYTLYGAEGLDGVPFWFLDDELIKL